VDRIVRPAVRRARALGGLMVALAGLVVETLILVVDPGASARASTVSVSGRRSSADRCRG
jgi:hypothetical protein